MSASSVPAAAPLVPKAPFLIAASALGATGGFIAWTAGGALGAAEWLGLCACACAATALLVVPWTLEHAHRQWMAQLARIASVTSLPSTIMSPQSASTPSPEALAALVAAAVDARLAAALPAWQESLTAAVTQAEASHREEVLRTLTQATTSGPQPIVAAQVTAPAGKIRLGRGLGGLIGGAVTKTETPENATAESPA